MKNKFLKLICAFLIIAILFSGCAKSKKEIVAETKSEPVSIETESDNKEEANLEAKLQKDEEVAVVEKEAEILLDDNEIPKEVKAEEKSALTVCSLIVLCDDILKNPEKLKEEKRSVVPQNGIIYKNENISFSEGESAFDILNRELIKNRIHFEFTNTPVYNSAYIEGIGNLYEFDCGSLSGWMYRVNGIKPNFGCSQYSVKNGDKIEFYYSCNFMKDNE